MLKSGWPLEFELCCAWCEKKNTNYCEYTVKRAPGTLRVAHIPAGPAPMAGPGRPEAARGERVPAALLDVPPTRLSVRGVL